MRHRLSLATILATSLVLSACGGGDDKAAKEGEASIGKGQVVATVNGKDVTIHQLNAELTGVAVPSGEARKQVEQQALQAVVARTILADLARERGIEKSPNFVLQRHRSEEALLVQLLQREIASKIPPPNKEDAAKFMSDNPDLFAQRKIFQLEQIQFEAPQDINKLRAFEPLKTMEQVEQRLIEDRLKYRKGGTNLDSVGANPGMIRQIAKLPAGEVFIIPQGGTFIANRIVNAKVVPFAGDQATEYAMNMIQQKKLAEATEKELKAKIDEARKKVNYQKGYEPPKPPAGATPAAPAGNASAPAN